MNCPAASSSASAWRARWPPSPNVLLMDEPFGALDPIIRAKAQDDLLAIQRRFGTTIVLVTHDMDEAIHLGDRIAVMDKGRLLQYATPAEIMARPGRRPSCARPDRHRRAAFRLLSLATARRGCRAGRGGRRAAPGRHLAARRAGRAALVGPAGALPVAAATGDRSGG